MNDTPSSRWARFCSERPDLVAGVHGIERVALRQAVRHGFPMPRPLGPPPPRDPNAWKNGWRPRP